MPADALAFRPVLALQRSQALRLVVANMNKTPIEWADYSSNPIRALNPEINYRGHYCEKVSPGCHRCYASTQNGAGHYPMSSTGVAYPAYPPGTKLPVPEARGRLEHYLNLNELRTWLNPNLKGKTIFPCDMTDLFGAWVSDEWLDIIFAHMALSSATFLVLTKRPERMREYMTTGVLGSRWVTIEGQAQNILHAKGWPEHDVVNYSVKLPLPNVILMVSVENQRWADIRIPQLLATPAAAYGLSCEPLLGALDLTRYLWPRLGSNYQGPFVDWVIAGGESAGPAKRALVERCDHTFADQGALYTFSNADACEFCHGTGYRPHREALEWARSLRNQCVAAGVPFFFKQWPIPPHKPGGPALIDGREWREFPVVVKGTT